LEKHPDDRHHCQAAIGDFSVEPPSPSLRGASSQERWLPTHVPRRAVVDVLIVACRRLAVGSVQDNLDPTRGRHLGDGGKAVRDVLEPEVAVWGQVARELARQLRGDVTHRGQHGDATMLYLRGSPAHKTVHVAILGVAGGIPKTDWGLHAKLILECAEGRSRVQCPIAPGGACQTILEKHPDDRHHCQAAIGDFSVEPPSPSLRGASSQERWLPTHVPRRAVVDVLIVACRRLAVGSVQDNLDPTRGRHLGDGGKAVRDVLEPEVAVWGQVARELARQLRGDVTHRGQHGDATMLYLRGSPPDEVVHVAIVGVASWIPESDRGLHAKFILERTSGKPHC